MDRTKKQNIIKNVIIIFLTVLLVLTFFSNTIMNYSLAEVGTTAVYSGTVTVGNRTSGVAGAYETYQVMSEDAREIESVEISVGDEVRAGDVLFTFVDAESDELKQAYTELDQLRLEYELGLLDVQIPSYAVDNTEVQALSRELDRAVQERNRVGTTSMTVSEGQQNLDSAQYEVDVWSGRVTDTQAQISQVESGDSSYSGIRSEAQALEKSENTLSEKQAAYDNMEAKGTHSDAELQKAHTEVTVAQDKVNAAASALNAKKASEKNTLTSRLDTQQASLNSANTALLNAQAAFNSVSNIKAAETAVTEARNNLNLKIQELRVRQGEDVVTKEKAGLSAESHKLLIEEKEAEIEKLEEKFKDGKVEARHGGTVSAVNVAAGKSVTEEDILALIDVTDMGYETEISVASTYTEGLEAGSEIEASRDASYGAAMSAEVVSIRNDSENPGNMLVALKLAGETYAGEALTFIIPVSSDTYDTIVPKSAVYQDNEGDFVYMITTKKSPLGTRYKAVRTPVNVLASNDTQAAVSGVDQGEYVITASSAVISTGDYVQITGSVVN